MKNSQPTALCKLCRLWLGLLVLITLTAHAGERIHSAKIDNPRAYGYFAGDHAVQTIHIKHAQDLELRHDSIPNVGIITPWIKLESVEIEKTTEAKSSYSKIVLRYQITGFEPDKDSVETPGFTLSIEKGREKLPVLVHPLKLHISRLSPPIGDKALSELVPASPLGPSRKSTALFYYLKWLSLAAGLTFLGWAIIRILSDNRNRALVYPFSAACKYISKPGTGSTGSALDARRILHTAFNQQFGRTLFESGLEQFFAEHTAFKTAEDDIRLFFRESRFVFFAPDTAAENTSESNATSTLLSLAKRCRNFEQQAAQVTQVTKPTP